MTESKRHGPSRLSNYLETHETILQQFRDGGFVKVDSLRYDYDSNNRLFVIKGAISCLGRIVIGVVKYLNLTEIDNEKFVQTHYYSHNVSIQNKHNLFRYDNSDHYQFHPPHHRHRFDWKTGELLLIERIGSDWPLLSEVIEEARVWYYENRSLLPEPNTYADLLITDEIEPI